MPNDHSLYHHGMPERKADCHPERRHHALGKCRNCHQRDFRASRPPRDRAAEGRKWRYGLTPTHFDNMLFLQGGRCDSCRVLLVDGGDGPDGLNVDHDHLTGVVRGLLCRACNLTIGHAKENDFRLQSCADYLRRVKI